MTSKLQHCPLTHSWLRQSSAWHNQLNPWQKVPSWVEDTACNAANFASAPPKSASRDWSAEAPQVWVSIPMPLNQTKQQPGGKIMMERDSKTSKQGLSVTECWGSFICLSIAPSIKFPYQYLSGSRVCFSEVYFYFRCQCKGKDMTLAILSKYSEPNSHLPTASHQTLVSHLLSPVNASYKRWSAYTCPPLVRGRNWANGLSWIAPG